MTGLIIFIILIAVFLLSFVGIFFGDIYDSLRRKNHSKLVYDLVSSSAEENDHLLLNDVIFMMNPSTGDRITYDHILFGDKYVYLIDTFCAKGGIYGNAVDNTLFLKDFKDNTKEINNPIKKALWKMDVFQDRMRIDSKDSIVIAVVVYNDSLIVPNGISMKSQNIWFIPASELLPTIRQAETDNVSSIREMCDVMMKRIKEESDWNKKELKRIGLR